MAKAAKETTDEELLKRVSALEGRMTTAETDILELDARVSTLESADGGNVDPPDPPDPNPEPEPEPEPPPAGTLSATITLAGKTTTYYEVDGVDMGNYVDPRNRFTMTCVRVKSPDCPIEVDFRRVEGWACVVGYYGDLSSSSASNLPAYTVVVDGQTIEVNPGHWKYAQWRWQSAAWPFPLRTIDELVADKLLPAFDKSVNHGTGAVYPALAYKPMGLAGVSPYMPGTGGRPDIGHVTDWQADYLCNGGATALANVLAQGEAGGTCPWNCRDPATGGPVDVTSDKWKGASFYYQNGNPQLIGGQGGDNCKMRFSGTPGATIKPPANWTGGPITIKDPGSPAQDWWAYGTLTIGPDGHVDTNANLASTSGRAPGTTLTIDPTCQISDPTTTVAYVEGTNIKGSGITLDISHEPALAYLPFILTGDPYYLGILQSQAAYIILGMPKGWSALSPSWGPGAGQTRGVAWATRDLMQAAWATPDVVPQWLLPKATMKKMFDASVAHLNFIMAQTEPLRSVHRAVASSRGSQASPGYPAGCYYQPWQEDFIQCVVAWGSMKFPELLPFAKWHVKGINDRINPDGMSGWCGGMPDPYSLVFQDTTNGPQYPTLEQAWTKNQAALGLTACPPLANLFVNASGYDYPNGMQAGLSISIQAGITEAKPALDVLANALEAGIVSGKGSKDNKWSMKRDS